VPGIITDNSCQLHAVTWTEYSANGHTRTTRHTTAARNDSAQNFLSVLLICIFIENCVVIQKYSGSFHSRLVVLQLLANVNSRSRSLYAITRPSVCRLSVTFVHPTQAIKIFGNVSTHLIRWPSVDIQVKFYVDRPRGTPSSGELKNTRGVAEYSDFGPIERYISETEKIGAKFVLINKSKSHGPMSVRLVPTSVTLDDLERRNSPNRRANSPNSVAFEANYVKQVEDTPILSAAEM